MEPDIPTPDNWPNAHADLDEVLVDPADVQRLQLTNLVKRCLPDYDGLIRRSERVTYSERFGYVFRYDIRKTIVTEKGVFTIEAVVVVFQPDSQSINIAHHALFELPTGFE